MKQEKFYNRKKKKIMTSEEAIKAAKKDIEEKFSVEFQKMEAGECVCVLPMREAYINSWGIPYGGILFNLADITAGAAYLSAGGNGITVSGHVDYMRGAQKGTENLTCRAKVSKAGKKFFFVDAFIEDDREKILCKFSFIFSNL